MSDFAITTEKQDTDTKYAWTAMIDDKLFGAHVLVKDRTVSPELDAKVRELLKEQYDRTVKHQQCLKDGHSYVSTLKLKGVKQYRYCENCHAQEEQS